MEGGEGQLRFYLNQLALDSMPPASSAPRGSFERRVSAALGSGFMGVQFAGWGTPSELQFCRANGLGIAASGRINLPREAAPLAEKAAGDGYECATVHAGWGLEDDDEAFALLDAILQAAGHAGVPLYVETHRATICQDMWRTVQLANKFPQLRFNGDFSHWYAGQEMVYGGFERKFEFIQPVLERVRFLHGRIASPGCIQVALAPPNQPQPEYVEHFRRLWTASFRGFLGARDTGFICFTPELLSAEIYYAHNFGNREESDRWEQSLLLNQIAAECFLSAQHSLSE